MKIEEAAVLTGTILFAWINILLLMGLTLRVIESFSFITVTGFLIGTGMAWPLKKAFSQIDSLNQTVLRFFRQNCSELFLTSSVFVISSISFVFGYGFPGSNILNISFHASSQIFFPIKILYADLLGRSIASFLFQYSRWYLHFMWLYLVIGLSYRWVSSRFKSQ